MAQKNNGTYPKGTLVREPATTSATGAEDDAPKCHAAIVIEFEGMSDAQVLSSSYKNLKIGAQKAIRKNWSTYRNKKEITFHAVDLVSGASSDAAIAVELAALETVEEKTAFLLKRFSIT